MTKQSKHVAPYPPEFRAEVIQLARSSGETVRLWVKQAELDEGQRSDGLTSDEQEELRRLHRRPARSDEDVRVR